MSQWPFSVYERCGFVPLLLLHPSTVLMRDVEASRHALNDSGIFSSKTVAFATDC